MFYIASHLVGLVMLVASAIGIYCRVTQYYSTEEQLPKHYSRQELDELAMEFLQEGSEYTYYFDMGKTIEEIENKIRNEFSNQIEVSEFRVKEVEERNKEVMLKNRELEKVLYLLDAPEHEVNGAKMVVSNYDELQNRAYKIAGIAEGIADVIEYIYSEFQLRSSEHSFMYGSSHRDFLQHIQSFRNRIDKHIRYLRGEDGK